MRAFAATLCIIVAMALPAAGSYCVVTGVLLDLVLTSRFETPVLTKCANAAHKCIECEKLAENQEFKVYKSSCGAANAPSKAGDSWSCRSKGAEPCASAADTSGSCHPLLLEIKTKSVKCGVFTSAELMDGMHSELRARGTVFCDQHCGAGMGFDSRRMRFIYVGCLKGCQRTLRDAVATPGGSAMTQCSVCGDARNCSAQFDRLRAGGRAGGEKPESSSNSSDSTTYRTGRFAATIRPCVAMVTAAAAAAVHSIQLLR